MTKQISITQFSPEVQKRIKLEVSNLKQSKKVISKTELSEEAKAFLDKVVKGKWTQRPDGKIDVKGDVWADFNKELHLFMGKEIFFGEVEGYFVCCFTKITSLKGAPEYVGGSFYCYETNITSLKGSPEKVGGYFKCSETKITSLKGAPKEVGGNFDCRNTKITSLKGAPEKVGRDFDCSETKITSLEGIGEVKGWIFSDLK